MSFNAICENKILTKISEFTVEQQFTCVEITNKKDYRNTFWTEYKICNMMEFLTYNVACLQEAWENVTSSDWITNDSQKKPSLLE